MPQTEQDKGNPGDGVVHSGSKPIPAGDMAQANPTTPAQGRAGRAEAAYEHDLARWFVYWPNGTRSPMPDEATARRCAASEDLLAALIRCVAQHDAFIPVPTFGGPAKRCRCGACNEARAAIALATPSESGLSAKPLSDLVNSEYMRLTGKPAPQDGEVRP